MQHKIGLWHERQKGNKHCEIKDKNVKSQDFNIKYDVKEQNNVKDSARKNKTFWQEKSVEDCDL